MLRALHSLIQSHVLENERKPATRSEVKAAEASQSDVCDSNGASGGRGSSVRKAATKAQIGANVWEPSVERPVSWRSTFHLNQEESWNHCVRSATSAGPNYEQLSHYADAEATGF